jgi:hypothetical protein
MRIRRGSIIAHSWHGLVPAGSADEQLKPTCTLMQWIVIPGIGWPSGSRRQWRVPGQHDRALGLDQGYTRCLCERDEYDARKPRRETSAAICLRPRYPGVLCPPPCQSDELRACAPEDATQRPALAGFPGCTPGPDRVQRWPLCRFHPVLLPAARPSPGVVLFISTLQIR